MKNLKHIFPCLLLLVFSGCYEEEVKEAVSKLQIGMTKTELDHICKDIRFLKAQTVLMYPNFDADEMRATLAYDQHYEYKYPKNLIDLLTFDGDIKVFSYLIRKKNTYANPPVIDHLAVFYSQKQDKVIGWGHLTTSGGVDTWRDKF